MWYNSIDLFISYNIYLRVAYIFIFHLFIPPSALKESHIPSHSPSLIIIDNFSISPSRDSNRSCWRYSNTYFITMQITFHTKSSLLSNKFDCDVKVRIISSLFYYKVVVWSKQFIYFKFAIKISKTNSFTDKKKTYLPVEAFKILRNLFMSLGVKLD